VRSAFLRPLPFEPSPETFDEVAALQAARFVWPVRFRPNPVLRASSDHNPIEMALAKLKAHLRARAVRTPDALWRAVGAICDLVEPHECRNYFSAAG